MEVFSAYSLFQKRVSGGPKWTRTTDLTSISRALYPAELWARIRSTRGGGYRTRTGDPLLAKQVLYQLS